MLPKYIHTEAAAYKCDSIRLYYTLYLNLDPLAAWLLRQQSLDGCHFFGIQR
jgi:hypothetical protein